MNLIRPLSLILLAVSPLALAGNSAQIEAETGPVTVTWGQPAMLVKADEYRVQVSDFDRNGDGRLSRAEIPADHVLQHEFRVVDSNHDRYLSAEELAPWR